MTQQQLLNEFFSLPAEAQRQVADLIASLKRKDPSATTEDAAQPIGGHAKRAHPALPSPLEKRQ